MQLLSDDRALVSSRLADVTQTLNTVEADALQLADMERLLLSGEAEEEGEGNFQKKRV